MQQTARALTCHEFLLLWTGGEGNASRWSSVDRSRRGAHCEADGRKRDETSPAQSRPFAETHRVTIDADHQDARINN
jgi:hypothetical protein